MGRMAGISVERNVTGCEERCSSDSYRIWKCKGLLVVDTRHGHGHVVF